MDLFTFLTAKGCQIELAELLVTAADACKIIAKELSTNVKKKVGTVNQFGEEQIAMDVFADKVFGEHMRACPYVAALGGEEMDEIEIVHPDGKFAVFSDPLDGSSLADVNFSVGTIVGIYEGDSVIGRTGREQAAAMYACYGPKTTIVLTFKKGVHAFILLNHEWQLFEENLLIGESKYFSAGNLRAASEREDYLVLVNSYIKDRYTLRYSGGMVPDINHIIFKGGGIFMYPGMPSAPDGKLRLLFECAPMSLIVEEAGGASSNGTIPLLDLKIDTYEQRTPIFIGSKHEVEKCVNLLKL